VRTDDIESEEVGNEREDPGLNGKERVGNPFVVACFF